jgi:phosphatidate cytidylyltransferase
MRWAELGSAVQSTIVGVFILLALSTLVVWVLRAVWPERDLHRISQRIETWWLLTGFFCFSVLAGTTVSILFFAFLSFLGLKEFLSLIPTRRADRRVLFWAYLAIPLQYYWVYSEWYGMFIVFIPVYMFLLLPMRMISIGQTEGFIRAAGTLHWGLMTMVFFLSHAAFLVVLRLRADSQEVLGPGLVMYLVVLTELNDVAQFLWGKSLGRRRVVPAVSPGKTWVGLIGGVVTTEILAIVTGPYLTPMHYGQAAVAGLIIGLGGFAGDLCISAMKRDLHIKDTGCFLPGHGGILDRIDSLTYTAPLFFHYVYWSFPFDVHGTGPLTP